MSQTPPSGPPSDARPDPGPPGPQRRVNRGAVAGGAVVGFLGTWLIFAVVAMALYSTYGDSTSTGQTIAGFAGLLILPAVALVLMISPRTRHAGAGLLMGIAIGSVVGAGVCATTLGLGM